MAIKVYPGWDTGNAKMQGLWRRYLKRLTHLGELRSIEGFNRPIILSALHLSFFFAPVAKFLRYFQEDKLEEAEKQMDEYDRSCR